MTTTNATREITETFEFTDENPIASNDWLTLTANPVKVAGGLAQPSVLDAQAWKDPAETGAPKNPDQEVRGIGYCIDENIVDGVGSISDNGSATAQLVTLSAKTLKRPAGSRINVTIAGASGFSPDVNGTWSATVVSETIVSLPITGAVILGTVDQATITVTDCYWSVVARLDDTISATDFTPNGGYEARLIFGESGAYSVRLARWERDTAVLTTVATNATPTIKKNTEFTATTGGLGVLQELRLTLEDLDDGGTRIKVYVNNDDEDSPDIEYLERVENTIKGPGTWGFQLGGPVGLDVWSAEDKFRDPGEGNMHAGRSLSEIRTDLQSEMSRGTNTTLDTAFLNRAVNRGLKRVMKDLGSLAWWLQREETFTITSTDTRTFELPPRVKSVEAFFKSADRTPLGKSVWALGYNAAGTALMFQTNVSLDGQSVIVHYEAHWGELENDTDRCAVPREHDELVVLAAALVAARRTADKSWLGELRTSYAEILTGTRREMNRLKRMQASVLRVENPKRDRFSDTRYVPDVNWLW